MPLTISQIFKMPFYVIQLLHKPFLDRAEAKMFDFSGKK